MGGLSGQPRITVHWPGPHQETVPEPTIYRRILADRIIGHARKNGTIDWVDASTGFMNFGIDFLVFGCCKLARKRHRGRLETRLWAWGAEGSHDVAAADPHGASRKAGMPEAIWLVLV